jgi:hypothetical protein
MNSKHKVTEINAELRFVSSEWFTIEVTGRILLILGLVLRIYTRFVGRIYF